MTDDLLDLLDLPAVPTRTPGGQVGFWLAHVSDTHLGHEQYNAMVSGFNQRGQDVVRAWDNVVVDVVSSDPPLVIHSGDAAHRPNPAINYMLEFMRQLERLAAIRPDGTRRQVVVIAGNHDTPRDLTQRCWLELCRRIPGVHVVTRGYKVITFDRLVDAGEADPALRDVAVHCLPHDDLRTADLDQVRPDPAKTGYELDTSERGQSLRRRLDVCVRGLRGADWPRRLVSWPTAPNLRSWSRGAVVFGGERGAGPSVRRATPSTAARSRSSA